MLFAKLPEDIIHHILSYDSVLKYRNGKYMNQIAKTDPRYELISQRVLYPRNLIFHTITNLKNIVIIFYRPYDIYWSIAILQEKVVYRYSLTMDNKDKNTIFYYWLVDWKPTTTKSIDDFGHILQDSYVVLQNMRGYPPLRYGYHIQY